MILGDPDHAIALPRASAIGEMSLEQAIRQRRSVRAFAPGALTLEQVAKLLWAAQGTNGNGGYRTVPSAGATYPLDACLVAGNVEGLIAGLYRYRPFKNDLEPMLNGDLRADLAKACLGQEWVLTAPASVILVAEYRRTTGPYGQRGVRYVDMEAGHAGQNLYLQAVCLGLATVAIGAFRDLEVSKVLALPEEKLALYVFPVGHPDPSID